MIVRSHGVSKIGQLDQGEISILSMKIYSVSLPSKLTLVCKI